MNFYLLKITLNLMIFSEHYNTNKGVIDIISLSIYAVPYNDEEFYVASENERTAKYIVNQITTPSLSKPKR